MLRTRDLSFGQAILFLTKNYRKTNRNQTKTIMGPCQGPLSRRKRRDYLSILGMGGF